MRRWRWVLLVIAVAVFAFRYWYWPPRGVTLIWNLSTSIVALLVVVGGLLVWGRRLGSRIGPLLTVWGLYALTDSIGVRESGWLFVFWWSAKPVFWALLAHTLLTYPDGRAETAAERWFLRLAYATPLFYLAAVMRVTPEQLLQCAPERCPPNPVQWEPSLSAFRLINGQLRPPVATVLGIWFVALILLRRRRRSPAQRRTANPVLWATIVPLAAFLYGSFLFVLGDYPPALGAIWLWASALSVYWVPLALLVGFYTTKLARAEVAAMLVRLRAADAAALGPALARLLRDPTLEIGPPLARPGPSDPRVATDLGGHGVLLHHPSARAEDPELFAAAVAAAAVTLENAHLSARVQAQLAEVSESRERLVRAADDERRRVERDLHDGAQQQLIGVGMTLQSARLAVDPASPAAELLDEASGQLRDSIAELRSLARGLRPALLTERGLAVALAELRRRVPVPVSLSVDLPDRLDPTIETTVYFVVAEALQNATRHGAGQVVVVVARDGGATVVRVRDDGPGGADPRAGSGLRGLADRVAAAGGSFTVTSPPGGGTTIEAVLP